MHGDGVLGLGERNGRRSKRKKGQCKKAVDEMRHAAKCAKRHDICV
jgi:hypothetical protein